MPKVSQDHLDERRAQILEAAAACFAKNGLHRSTMQDIILESELSPGAIYNYFDGKQAIILALVDERHARERKVLDRARSEPTPSTALRRLLRDFFVPLRDARVRADRRLGIQLWAEALRNPEILAVIRKGVDEPRRVLTELVLSAQKRGEVSRGVDADAVARAFIGLFHGLVLQQAWDERVDVTRYVAVLEKMLGGLLAAPSRRRGSLEPLPPEAATKPRVRARKAGRRR